MIELLVSSLLPFMPFLENPALRYNEAAQRIEARLRTIAEANGDAHLNIAPPVISDKKIPPLTGRLLHAAQELAPSNVSPNPNRVSEQFLRLTGVIEADGQRVGIVSNGQQDVVVGVGSYVFGEFRVIEVGQYAVVMTRLASGKQATKTLTLKLTSEVAAGVDG
jgi:hypothetical protein